MVRLKQSMTARWSALGLAARLWWAGLVDGRGRGGPGAGGHDGLGRLVAPGTQRVGASSGVKSSAGGGSSGSMAGMKMGGSSNSGSSSTPTSTSTSTGAAQATSAVCSNVKGATVMSNGMVMAPVPSGTADGGPAGGGRPARGADQGHALQVRRPLGRHRGRVHPGHQPERVPGPLRQLADRQDGRVRSVAARVPRCTPTRSTAPSSWAPCISGRHPAHPVPTSADR